MKLRPSGYEPDELPGCSTPRQREGVGEQAGGRIWIYCDRLFPTAVMKRKCF